jgi:hypothetical protein
MPQQPSTTRDDHARCPQCATAPMDEVVTIAPLGEEPGLVAYECPRCGYVTSLLLSAAHAHPGKSR